MSIFLQIANGAEKEGPEEIHRYLGTYFKTRTSMNTVCPKEFIEELSATGTNQIPRNCEDAIEEIKILNRKFNRASNFDEQVKVFKVAVDAFPAFSAYCMKRRNM